MKTALSKTFLRDSACGKLQLECWNALLKAAI